MGGSCFCYRVVAASNVLLEATLLSLLFSFQRQEVFKCLLALRFCFLTFQLHWHRALSSSLVLDFLERTLGRHIDTYILQPIEAMAAHLCCTHPRQLESPTPPCRPPPGIDDAIFAVASLPADHPHALRLLPRRRHSEAAREDGSILKSPRFADKVRLKLGKKSCKTLRVDGADDGVEERCGVALGSLPVSGRYDEDARVLGSEEVLCLGCNDDGKAEDVAAGYVYHFSSLSQ